MRIELAVPVSPYFGYGVCGAYLLDEFSKRGEVSLQPMGESLTWDNQFDELIKKHTKKLTGDVPLLQFPADDFAPQTNCIGKPNALYLFSEWEPITEKQKDNLRKYDVLIAGSEWNAQVIRDAGFQCYAVPQGVDQSVFYPKERNSLKDRFVIYSGGKLEHRKGQDLVTKAVDIFCSRHDDVLLVTNWFNIWQGYSIGQLWFPHWEWGLLSQKELCQLMNQTDVGIFPNRCEGGTNLVMMEYMACGKPVIANFGTGQKDVLDKSYALEAATVDEIVYQLETLYQDREKIKRMGALAHDAMKNWTWARTADGILGAMA